LETKFGYITIWVSFKKDKVTFNKQLKVTKAL